MNKPLAILNRDLVRLLSAIHDVADSESDAPFDEIFDGYPERDDVLEFLVVAAATLDAELAASTDRQDRDQWLADLLTYRG